MKLVPLYNLFNIKYGNSLELINLEQCSKEDVLAINYVSRTENNNGISAIVRISEAYTANPPNTISVAVSGSVLSSFLQPQPYYTGFHMFVLSPIVKMSQVELLFYCQCLRANKYKYNYGRQANRTLKDILVPDSLPKEFSKININNIEAPTSIPLKSMDIDLVTDEWRGYELGELFTIEKGKRLTKEDMSEGHTPFIGAIDSNNGYREFIGQPALHSGNTITVNYNGSVGEAFYQPLPFWASDDVNVLYPKFDMNVYIALFIVTIIKREKYRFNFGRKWHSIRMAQSAISLPSKNGVPNYSFMENYMKSLPYSASLLTDVSAMQSKPPKKKKAGLTDAELAAKYDTGERVDFDSALNKMAKSPSNFSTKKAIK